MVPILGTSAVLWVVSINPFILSTFFYDDRQPRQDLYRKSCIDKSSITPTGFSNERATHLSVFTVYWPTDAFGLYNSSMSDMVSGFFAGCFPLDAALVGTLDCLSHQECLGMLRRYFPDANRVGILLRSKTSLDLCFQSNVQQWPIIPSSRQQNLSVEHLVSNLFVDEWLTDINYTDYFHQCAPSECTYEAKDATNWSYAITIFIGLYGGLTAILRLLASSLVLVLFFLSPQSIRMHLCCCTSTHLRQLMTRIRRWNVFKSPTHRTEQDIRLQRISTRFFLILLTGNRSSVETSLFH